MSTTLVDIDRIDRDLADARAHLGRARRACARCPSGENARLVAEALAGVDRLLDLRLSASR